MKVKCRICGSLIERDSAYKVVKNDSAYYYCSKEEYDNKQRIIEQKKSIFDVYVYCVGDDKLLYSLIQKEIKESYDGDDVIERVFNFVSENKKKLKNSIEYKVQKSGNFDSKFNEINYLTAIIKKQITSPTPLPEPPKPIDIKVDVGFYENSKSPSTQRRSLSELEDIYGR